MRIVKGTESEPDGARRGIHDRHENSGVDVGDQNGSG